MKIKKILVVEDDMIIQMFLSRIITNLGFDVIGEARTWQQVMQIIQEDQPDLILMDIGIAGEKDGVETAELIKKDYDIPIIFITGNSDESTIERAKKINPLDFIFKPIGEERLTMKLNNLKND